MNSRKSLGPIGGIVLGSLFACAGFAVAFYFGKPILDNAKASESWPSVVGVNENSEVATSKSDGKTMYSPDVLYVFTVDGRSYKSSTVSFGGDWSSSSSSSAYQVVNRYPAGMEVEVHYAVGEPSNSVLEPGVTWQSYLVYGFGLAFLGVGVLILGTSALRLVGFGFLITAVVAGWIGKNRHSDDRSFSSPQPFPEQPEGSFASAAPIPGRTDRLDDDGIDIG